VVVSTEEVSAGAVLVLGSTGEASAVAVSTAALAFVGDVSAVVLSTAAALVAAVSAVVISTAVAFVVAVSITGSLMMSSSATSAFRAGGAIRTDITVTVTTITHTITMAMDTVGTHTATTMDMADTVTTVAVVTDTAMAADQDILGVCGVGDMPGYGSLKSLAC
jgi:hypothetical protein